MRRMLLVASLTAGCQGSDVYRISTVQNGIPFFPLVPVNQEVRQQLQQWTRVDVNFTIEQKIAGENTWKPTVRNWSFNSADTAGNCSGSNLTKDSQTQAGLVRFIENKVTAAEEQTKTDLGDRLKKHAQPAPGTVSASKKLEDELDNTRSCDEPPIYDKKDHLDDIIKLQSIGVTRSILQQPALEPQYINIFTPYGGSATGTVSLDPRGVLTGATGTKTDSLPSTIATTIGAVASSSLSAFGTIGAAIFKPAAAASTLAKANTFAEIEDNALFGKDEGAEVITNATITVTAMRRVYTVTSVWNVAPAPAPAPSAPAQAPIAPRSIDTSANLCLGAASSLPASTLCQVGVTVDLSGALPPSPSAAPAPSASPVHP